VNSFTTLVLVAPNSLFVPSQQTTRFRPGVSGFRSPFIAVAPYGTALSAPNQNRSISCLTPPSYSGRGRFQAISSPACRPLPIKGIGHGAQHQLDFSPASKLVIGTSRRNWKSFIFHGALLRTRPANLGWSAELDNYLAVIGEMDENASSTPCARTSAIPNRTSCHFRRGLGSCKAGSRRRRS
jgi:hypothetical protein